MGHKVLCCLNDSLSETRDDPTEQKNQNCRSEAKEAYHANLISAGILFRNLSSSLMNLICDFRPIRHTLRPNAFDRRPPRDLGQIAGSALTDIAAGADGTVWGVKGVGKIYRHVHA